MLNTVCLCGKIKLDKKEYGKISWPQLETEQIDTTTCNLFPTTLSKWSYNRTGEINKKEQRNKEGHNPGRGGQPNCKREKEHSEHHSH